MSGASRREKQNSTLARKVVRCDSRSERGSSHLAGEVVEPRAAELSTAWKRASDWSRDASSLSI